MTRSGTRSLCALVLLVTVLAPACRKKEDVSAPTSRSSGGSAGVTPVEDADVAVLPTRPAGGKSRVIWLGLDGLDWDLLDRLARERKMPNWSRLTSEGFTAALASFFPVLSPVIWTTAATL